MDVNDNLLERIASDPRILKAGNSWDAHRSRARFEMMAAGMTHLYDRLSPDDIRACLTYAYRYVAGDLWQCE